MAEGNTGTGALEWLKSEIEAKEAKWDRIVNKLKQNEAERATLMKLKGEIEEDIRYLEYIQARIEGRI